MRHKKWLEKAEDWMWDFEQHRVYLAKIEALEKVEKRKFLYHGSTLKAMQLLIEANNIRNHYPDNPDEKPNEWLVFDKSIVEVLNLSRMIKIEDIFKVSAALEQLMNVKYTKPLI